MAAKLSPVQAQEQIATQADSQLIDVREYPEYAAGHAQGAILVSLSSLKKGMRSLAQDKPVIVLCYGGQRAAKAADKLEKAGFGHVAVVEGGTKAWQMAGLPMQKEAYQPWAIERQVRLAAGALVVIGLFLPGGFPYLSAFVGAGLMFAALTNFCGMAILLGRMPWNRGPMFGANKAASSAGASCNSKGSCGCCG